jgi:ribosome-binding protein aMBF1 (putative translation factor)
MTGAEFTEALASIGWSRRHLAYLLECDLKLALRWEQEAAPIPPSIAKWLERLAQFHMKQPPPDDWRVRYSVGSD